MELPTGLPTVPCRPHQTVQAVRSILDARNRRDLAAAGAGVSSSLVCCAALAIDHGLAVITHRSPVLTRQQRFVRFDYAGRACTP